MAFRLWFCNNTKVKPLIIGFCSIVSGNPNTNQVTNIKYFNMVPGIIASSYIPTNQITTNCNLFLNLISMTFNSMTQIGRDSSSPIRCSLSSLIAF